MTIYKDNQSILSTHADAKWSDDLPNLSSENINEIQKVIGVSEISERDFLNRIYANLISNLTYTQSLDGKKLTTQVKEEIADFQRAHKKYLDALSKTSVSTKDAINNEIMNDQINFGSCIPNYLGNYEADIQDKFFVIQKAIANIDIIVKKSKDNSLLQNTIYALAKWYELETGALPKRNFDGIDSKESGKFLELIKAFIQFLPDDLQKTLPSNPSGLIRQILEDMADKS
jgi:hypothetical protein